MPQSLVEHFLASDPIAVRDHLTNRKLAKYFNRETSAAIVCASRLLQGRKLDPATAFHYSMQAPLFEDYGLTELHGLCRDTKGRFDSRAFIASGVPTISPLTQFKVLYNMPLCFVAIEHGLQGDSSVHFGPGEGFFEQVALAPTDALVLVGAGQTHRDGAVTMGMALVSPSQLEDIDPTRQILDVLRGWSEGEP